MNVAKRKKITRAAWQKMVKDGDYALPIHDKAHTRLAVMTIARCEFPDLPEVRTMVAKVFEAAERFKLDTRGVRKLYPWLPN